MKYTLEHGKRYGAWIQLSGLATWASDGTIQAKFEEFGFKEIKIQVRDEEDRLVIWGTWGKPDLIGEMPEGVIYAEEAPST